MPTVIGPEDRRIMVVMPGVLAERAVEMIVDVDGGDHSSQSRTVVAAEKYGLPVSRCGRRGCRVTMPSTALIDVVDIERVCRGDAGAGCSASPPCRLAESRGPRRPRIDKMARDAVTTVSVQVESGIVAPRQEEPFSPRGPEYAQARPDRRRPLGQAVDLSVRVV